MAAAEPGVDWLMRSTLEERLRDWAREYSGPITVGRPGPHILARLIEFGGFLPGSSSPRNQVMRTEADEIEDIVRRMERGYPWNAAILRYDYFHPDMAMESRLGFLRADGVEISRTNYFERLNLAKHFVAGALLGARDLRPD
jgi:hypothetical protein